MSDHERKGLWDKFVGQKDIELAYAGLRDASGKLTEPTGLPISDEAAGLLVQGTKYFEGSGGLPQDWGKARKCFERAHTLGHWQARLWLAVVCQSEGDYKEAIRLYEFYPRDPQALCRLSDLYAKGAGVTRDLKKSEDYLRAAAKERYAPALFQLAEICRARGEWRMARTYFTSAKAAGHKDAAAAIADLLAAQPHLVTPEERLANLKAEMQQAVLAEDFLRAAELKEEIARLSSS